MLKLITQFMLEGISFNMQNDGIMLTITLSKGIFSVHKVVPIQNLDLANYPHTVLLDLIRGVYASLLTNIREQRRFPHFPPPQPANIK